MAKLLKGTVRGSKAGVVFVLFYMSMMMGAFLFPAGLGKVAVIVNTPGVLIAEQIHEYALDEGIDWLSVMTPQSVLDDFTVPHTTPIITGTYAIIAIAVMVNVLLYYLVGKVIEKRI